MSVWQRTDKLSRLLPPVHYHKNFQKNNLYLQVSLFYMTRSPRRPARGSFRDQPDDDDEESSPSSRRPKLRQTSSGSGLPGLLANFNNWLAGRRQNAVVEPQHIEFSKRLIALGIDFGAGFVVSMFVLLIPLVNMFLSQTLVIVLFLFGRDMLFAGRGIGKNFMGLKVVDIYSGNAPSPKQIIVRNATYLGPIILMQLISQILQLIPAPQVTTVIAQVCTLLFTLYELVILSVEIYRSYQREDSMRLGDELAGTCLAEADMNFSN